MTHTKSASLPLPCFFCSCLSSVFLSVVESISKDYMYMKVYEESYGFGSLQYNPTFHNLWVSGVRDVVGCIVTGLVFIVMD